MDIAKYVLPFEVCDRSMVNRVGGKCASLGELLKAQIPVPPGFAITTDAYVDFLRENNLTEKILDRLTPIEPGNTDHVESAAADIRCWVEAGKISEFMEDVIADQYRLLARRSRMPAVPVAVRSSATAEDLPGGQFCGPAGYIPMGAWRGRPPGQSEEMLGKPLWAAGHRLSHRDGIRSPARPDQRRSSKNGPLVHRGRHVYPQSLDRRSSNHRDQCQLGIWRECGLWGSDARRVPDQQDYDGDYQEDYI